MMLGERMLPRKGRENKEVPAMKRFLPWHLRDFGIRGEGNYYHRFFDGKVNLCLETICGNAVRLLQKLLVRLIRRDQTMSIHARTTLGGG